MFRPEVTRKTFRGEIQLFNNIYYSYDLAAEHGNEVRVSYDIHDANSVIVRRADGSYICDAIWNGNKVDAFAKPVIEQKLEKRVRAALHGPRRKSKRLNASLPRPLRRSLTLIWDMDWNARRKRKRRTLFIRI